MRDAKPGYYSTTTLMVFWDRHEVHAKGSMANLVDLAQENGIKVVHIDCSEWRKAQTQAKEVEVNGANHEFMSELEPMHMP